MFAWQHWVNLICLDFTFKYLQEEIQLHANLSVNKLIKVRNLIFLQMKDISLILTSVLYYSALLPNVRMNLLEYCCH